MAKLHLLRQGTGYARVAGSFEVPAERVGQIYGLVRVRSTEQLLDGRVASPLLLRWR